MDKSSSVKCLLYSDVLKGEPSPTGRGRRRSRDEKGNLGVGDFRFTNILQIFPFFFNYATLSLFSILFLPTTSTHTHNPRHLAILQGVQENHLSYFTTNFSSIYYSPLDGILVHDVERDHGASSRLVCR